MWAAEGKRGEGIEGRVRVGRHTRSRGGSQTTDAALQCTWCDYDMHAQPCCGVTTQGQDLISNMVCCCGMLCCDVLRHAVTSGAYMLLHCNPAANCCCCCCWRWDPTLRCSGCSTVLKSHLRRNSRHSTSMAHTWAQHSTAQHGTGRHGTAQQHSLQHRAKPTQGQGYVPSAMTEAPCMKCLRPKCFRC
jgi:hypothetical protein